MKKYIAFLLAALMLSAVSCSSGEAETEETAAPETEASEAVETTEEVPEEPVKKESLGKRVVFGALEFIWDNWKICGTVLIAIWAVNQILELLEKVKKFF